MQSRNSKTKKTMYFKKTWLMWKLFGQRIWLDQKVN